MPALAEVRRRVRQRGRDDADRLEARAAGEVRRQQQVCCRADAERGEVAVVAVGQARVFGVVPDMAAGGFGNVGNRRGIFAVERRVRADERAAVRVDGRKAAGRVVVVAALEVIVPAPAAVVIRQVFDDRFIRLSLRGPGPAVAGRFAAVEEVIQQDEARCQRMLVRRHVLRRRSPGRADRCPAGRSPRTWS